MKQVKVTDSIAGMIDMIVAEKEIDEKEIIALFLNMGAMTLVDEARRLQASKAFSEKKIVDQDDPIPLKFIIEAFDNLYSY